MFREARHRAFFVAVKGDKLMIALYCRVSTDEQAQHGYSIGNQRERLEAFCVSQGWQNYQFYVDDGYTGTNMDRPALKKMIRHIEKGEISTVVVYKLDRLSRKQKDVLFLLEDVFEANGVSFKSATEPFDTSTPLGKAMLGILAVFAQLERDTIVERVTSGRRRRVRTGKWYGGRVPFGYRWNAEDEVLEIVPEQAELVKKVFSMYLQGNSYLSIADWLAARTKDRVIDHSVIRDMLQRPVYTGHFNNAGVLVRGNHEAIIDMETFERVQKEIQRRKEGRAPLGNYLLSGLLKCGVCGGPVIHVIARGGKNNRIKYHYYACKAQHVRRKDRDNDCSLGYHPMEKIDEWVAERIKQMSLNPQEVEKELARQSTGQNENEEIIEHLEKALEEVNRKLERWYDAFEQGALDPAQLKRRVDALEEEKKAILARLDEIDDLPCENNIDDLINMVATIGEAWDDMTFDEQKTVLRAVVDHIILYPDKEPEIVWNV